VAGAEKKIMRGLADVEIFKAEREVATATFISRLDIDFLIR
jgi:hypothetical protein